MIAMELNGAGRMEKPTSAAIDHFLTQFVNGEFADALHCEGELLWAATRYWEQPSRIKFDSPAEDPLGRLLELIQHLYPEEFAEGHGHLSTGFEIDEKRTKLWFSIRENNQGSAKFIFLLTVFLA